MRSRIKQFLQFAFFFLAGAIILYLLYQAQSTKYLEECNLRGIAEDDCNLIDKILTDFKEAKYGWIILVAFLFMVSNFLRAIRWAQLLEPLGYKIKISNAFMATMIGYFTNLGLPRMGEVIKSGILAKYEKVEVEKVLGTVVTDRIIDLIMLAFIILLTLLIEFDIFWNYLKDNQSISDSLAPLVANPYLSILIVAIFIIVLYVLLRSSFIHNSFIFKKIQKLLTGFSQGLASVRKLKNSGSFLIYTIAIWVIYYFMTYLCFFAFEPTWHLGPSAGLLSFVFGTLGFVFPSPGGMGSYHFLVMEALKLYGVASTDAFSFANILFFSITIFCTVFFGLLSLIFISIFNVKD